MSAAPPTKSPVGHRISGGAAAGPLDAEADGAVEVTRRTRSRDPWCGFVVATGGRTDKAAIYPENRAMKPTGRLIFAPLAGMKLIPATATGPPVIQRPTDTQLRLLELLGTDPRAQR